MSDTKIPSRIFNGTLSPLPGVYTLDPVHTQHLVVGHVLGRFDELTGMFTIAEDPTLSSLEVSIETTSISTHNSKKDKDLRSSRFFHVEKFPTVAYRSTNIVAELDGQWTIEGQLTIRNITVPVTLSASITGIINDPSSPWVFGDKQTGCYLLKFSWFPIERHTLVKGRSSPDDPALRDYWEKRQAAKAKDLTFSKQKLAKRQKGHCPECGESLFNDEELQVHHLLARSKGGKDSYSNLALVHLLCHQHIHAKTQRATRGFLNLA
jgi:polyisoprenoid-binding protein YceI